MKTSTYLKTVFEFCTTLIVVLFIGLFLHAFGAPHFITPNMMKRNGLTDEQYENFWKIGKNPRIEQAAAREWMFRAYRYGNVTNWLEIIGKTNNFAALSYKLHNDNEILDASNKIYKAWNGTLVKSNEWLNVELEYTKQYEKTIKDLEKAARKDSKNLGKLRKEVEKFRDKAETDGFRETCQIILDILPVPNK